MATPFFFTTGDPDGKIATATRPDASGKFEIESADDFVLTSGTTLTSATFTGLIPAGSSVNNVVVEVYRVFPNDSDTVRTPNVPTRTNSPSDVAFESRDFSGGTLTFATSALGPFDVQNSVKPGGIHPKPGQTTGGDGAVAGEQEVQFNISFTDPFSLPADHYFFVPQVELDTGDFLWLSAPRPIVVPPGTAFPAGFTDLQSWTRDANLDPDWLRIGQDIVGGDAFPTFNAAFSLTGVTVPEPGTLAVFGTGLLGLMLLRRSASQR
jgi:hypothetical protein